MLALCCNTTDLTTFIHHWITCSLSIFITIALHWFFAMHSFEVKKTTTYDIQFSCVMWFLFSNVNVRLFVLPKTLENHMKQNPHHIKQNLNQVASQRRRIVTIVAVKSDSISYYCATDLLRFSNIHSAVFPEVYSTYLHSPTLFNRTHNLRHLRRSPKQHAL